MKEIQNKNVSMKYIELTRGDTIENILQELYIERQMSIREVANEIGVHYNTISKWIKMAGLEMRLPHQKMLEIVEIKRRLKENV